MPKIVAVTTENDLLEVVSENNKPIEYFDIGDVCVDLRKGLYQLRLQTQHPNKQIKEFRIVLSSPIKT